MSYFAAAVVRHAGQWSATEVSLTDAADVEDVADRLRDADPAADVSLLFVESDDAYLAILRLDRGEDLRVFGSDAAFAEESRVGALLLGDVENPPGEIDVVLATVESGSTVDGPEGATDSSRAAAGAVTEPASGDPTGVEPTGDADLLVDLGVRASQLIDLCRHEGLLPSDITAELCTAIGCGDEVEELREA